MINNDTHIVFDLDDTLYKEIDFVKSAYIFINNYLKISVGLDLSTQIDMCINNNINFFDFINSKIITQKKLSIEKYLELYRFHFPTLSLPDDTKQFLNELMTRKIEFSIITDGRSISQRNKIRSLGIYDKAQNIIISEETGFEKPDLHNFKLVENLNINKKYIYIADNTSKDFIAPNALNWDTICLVNNGQNIHKQNFDLDDKFMPKNKIYNLLDLI
tara:strand:- start:1612 stop:2262 length:651 start_codon:yes stop_codon:yes gene_type:complete